MPGLDLLHNGTLGWNFTNSTDVTQHIVDVLKRQYEDYFLLALNIGALVIFVTDKCRAVQGEWRVREVFLYGCCLNAPIASILSMLVVWHKVRKIIFYLIILSGLVLMYQSYGFLADKDWSWWKVLGLVNIGLALVELVATIGDRTHDAGYISF